MLLLKWFAIPKCANGSIDSWVSLECPVLKCFPKILTSIVRQFTNGPLARYPVGPFGSPKRYFENRIESLELSKDESKVQSI